MTDSIDSVQLGGTLFIPATHKNLLSVVNLKKYPKLKSVVIDTEDSLKDDDLAEAMFNLKEMLKSLEKTTLFIFIRPRNPDFLKQLLDYENIEKIEGFILPKFSLDNSDVYLNLLKETNHLIMPSIEGRELFNHLELYELKEKLLKHKARILLVRFGLEDMLRQLGLRRKCDESLFEYASAASVLGNFIATFKSSGFEISGGVYPCFEDVEGFKKDVRRDMKEGLFSKTLIHPAQIEIINELYKVSKEELDEALEICAADRAVFNQRGKMAESSTMRPYSKQLIKRAEIYGIN